MPWLTPVLGIWAAIGPLAGIFLGHYLTRSWQRKHGRSAGQHLLEKTEPVDPPIWASVGTVENKHLTDLMSVASANFGRHVDGFLRHRETGIKNLAAILAAESAVVGFALTNEKIRGVFIVTLLVILALAAVALTRLAVSQCRRAFLGELESLFLMAKVAWAMGVMFNVDVDQKVARGVRSPGSADKTLYAPRWAKDCLAYATCEAYVDANFRNPENTFSTTRLTIVVVGVSASALGLIGAVLVGLHWA